MRPMSHNDGGHFDRRHDEGNSGVWYSSKAEKLGQCMRRHRDEVSDQCSAAMEDLQAAMQNDHNHGPDHHDHHDHHGHGHHGCRGCIVALVVAGVATCCIVRRCRKKGKCRRRREGRERRGCCCGRRTGNGYSAVSNPGDDEENIEMGSTPTPAQTPNVVANAVAVVPSTSATAGQVVSGTPVVVSGASAPIVTASAAAGATPTMQYVVGPDGRAMWVQLSGTPATAPPASS